MRAEYSILHEQMPAIRDRIFLMYIKSYSQRKLNKFTKSLGLKKKVIIFLSGEEYPLGRYDGYTKRPWYFGWLPNHHVITMSKWQLVAGLNAEKTLCHELGHALQVEIDFNMDPQALINEHDRQAEELGVDHFKRQFVLEHQHKYQSMPLEVEATTISDFLQHDELVQDIFEIAFKKVKITYY